MRIRTARDEHPGARRIGVMANYRRMAASIGHQVTTTVRKSHQVIARVNHGRWLADCDYCNGAELVDPAEPVFMCLTCGNAELGGEFRPVKFPKDKHIAEAMAILEEREEANQNWEPEMEDVAFLRAENIVYLRQGQKTLRQLTQPQRRGR